MTKVSIIVPIYNVEKYLPQCIDSILNQTEKDFELILINDGSPDNSEAICLKYKENDTRIKYLSQQNQGVSAARNLGLKNAIGDFIFFMDSDDTINRDFIELAYNKAISTNSDIVVCGKYFQNRMPHPPALPVCAMFLKSDFYKKYNEIVFPIGIQPCEDGLFSHQLLALTENVALEENTIYNYREHSNGNHIQINNQCSKVIKQVPKWFEILTDFYSKYDLWEKKSLHLAKFIEHEPFEFRYLAMTLTYRQKENLYNLILSFYNSSVRGKLSPQDFKSLTNKFRFFISHHNVIIFEIYLVLIKFLDKFKKMVNIKKCMRV